jgi:hypothetical protein
MIIAIEIKRTIKGNNYRRNEDGIEFKPPLSRVYIFSEEGKLQDEETDYNLNSRNL